MKALKIIGIILAALILIFLAMGFIKSEITYQSEVIIDKPIEEVWAITQDESRITEWLSEVKRMEHISGEKGEVGAVSKIYVEQNGEEMFMEETITAKKHQEMMAMTFTMDFMNMDYEMHLEDMGGKTKVWSTSTTVGNGIFAKSLLAFMGGAMKQQEDVNMQKLKSLAESNTKVY